MKLTTNQLILKAVEESKKFPNPTIEYSFSIIESKNVQVDNFYGVKAVFNKQVTNDNGYQITYKY